MSSFKFFGFSEVLNEPSKEFLVQGLIGKGDLCMIYGPAKSGKTFVAFDIVGALIRGNCHFANCFAVREAVPVVYATGEGQSGLPNRLRSLDEKWGFTEEEKGRLTLVKQVPQLYRADLSTSTEGFVRDLRDRAGREALTGGLLVLDTWARSTAGADENTSKDTTEILSALSALKEELGCTVMAIHHANKGGSLRGSTNIEAGFDTVIHVRKSIDGVRSMGCGIAKDSPETADTTFKLRQVAWQTEEGHLQASASVEWGDKLSDEESSADRLHREVGRLLREEALGEENGLTAQEIKQRLGTTASEQVVREVAFAQSEISTSCIRTVERPVFDKNGKSNKLARHFYFEASYVS